MTSNQVTGEMSQPEEKTEPTEDETDVKAEDENTEKGETTEKPSDIETRDDGDDNGAADKEEDVKEDETIMTTTADGISTGICIHIMAALGFEYVVRVELC